MGKRNMQILLDVILTVSPKMLTSDGPLASVEYFYSLGINTCPFTKFMVKVYFSTIIFTIADQIQI